jgi:hypothetical protein
VLSTERRIGKELNKSLRKLIKKGWPGKDEKVIG